MKTMAGVALLLILASFAGASWAQDDIEDHPGYVDIDAEQIFGDAEAKLELRLEGTLLRLIGGSGEDEGMLASIKLIRVNMFEIKDNSEEVLSKFAALGDRLADEGWERVLHAEEDDESINIFIRSNDEAIQGLALLAAESDEAIFANIVGEVNSQLLSHLGDDFLGGNFDLSGIAEVIKEHEAEKQAVEETEKS